MTPDPYQGNSGGPGDVNNPQSWNRYAYAIGDPVNGNDPIGLFTEGTEDDGSGYDDSPWGSPFYYYASPMQTTSQAYETALFSFFAPQGAGKAAQSQGVTVSSALQILSATYGAADRLFSSNCAGLFLSPANNTFANRQALAQQLESLDANGTIRQISSAASNQPPTVPAFTTGPGGLIYIVSGGAFFTGTINGNSLGGPFAGLPVAAFDQLILLHELLHWTGVAGPDNKNQTNTLANGDKVKGSQGISKEVLKDCFGNN
jgi:hypothetical protein